jgi:hypothetical protein
VGRKNTLYYVVTYIENNAQTFDAQLSISLFETLRLAPEGAAVDGPCF